MRTVNPSRIAVVALMLWTLTNVTHADVTYHVTVDTSPLSGLVGFLDLQLNPGGTDALDVTATIFNPVTDGTWASTSTNSGGASGTLPGPPNVTIVNSGAINDLFQGMTFGNTLSFDAVFSGTALLPGLPLPLSGSTFSLSLYDTSTMPLLTMQLDGSMLHIDINPDGSTSTVSFEDGSGVLRAQATMALPVPESSPIILLFTGLAPLAVVMWHRRKA